MVSTKQHSHVFAVTCPVASGRRNHRQLFDGHHNRFPVNQFNYCKGTKPCAGVGEVDNYPSHIPRTGGRVLQGVLTCQKYLGSLKPYPISFIRWAPRFFDCQAGDIWMSKQALSRPLVALPPGTLGRRGICAASIARMWRSSKRLRRVQPHAPLRSAQHFM